MFTGTYNILVGIIIPSLIGWILIRYLYKSNPTKDIMAQIAYSFLSGFGIINIIFTVNVTTGYGFNRNLVYIIASISIIHFIFYMKDQTLSNIKNHVMSMIHTLVRNKLILLAILLGISSIIFSANWPVRDWDSIALYDFRAKIFANGLRIEDLKPIIRDNYYYRYYFVYPYMTSIAHAWSYVLGATSVIPIYAGFYMSIILFFTNFAHNNSNKKSNYKINSYLISSIPILVALTPDVLSHASMAYTNLPYTAYFLASLLPILDVNNSDNTNNYYWQYILSGLMLASGVLTRFTEPFYISIILVACYQALKSRKILIALAYPVFIFAVRKLWMIYAIFGDELSIKAIPSVISKFDFVFFYQVERFLLEHYIVNIMVPLFIMCIFFVTQWIKTKKIDHLFAIFWITNIGILFIGGFFFAARMDIWKDIGGSAERMVIVFIPIFYYWAMYLFNRHEN